MTQKSPALIRTFTRIASRPQRLLSSVLSMGLLAVLLTAVTTSMTHEPAAAATTGAGYSGITPYGGFLGNYVAPDGTRVYCMESGRPWPSGATDGGALVGSLATEWGAGLSAGVLQRLNYALTTFGETADPTQAAAVAAYVYSYTANYSRHAGQGHHVGAHYIDGNAAVLAVFDVVWAQTEANFAGVASGSAALSISMANERDGYLSVTTNPTNAVGMVTLTGAVGAVSGSSTVSMAHGQVVPIRGIPTDSDTSYSIRAHGTFAASSGASPTVTVYSTGSQQRTIRAGAPSEVRFETAAATGVIGLRFSPIVRTQVAGTFVEAGGVFVDALAASVSDTSALWRTLSDGSAVAVVATGTLYGPFIDRPTVAIDPPADAPVVGTESVTLTGPGAYVSAGTFTALASGFYTWVWSIDSATQSPASTVHLTDGYRFADRFGLVAETHVVPLTLAVVSRVSTQETGFGGEIADQLTVALADGQWLTESGRPVPAEFEGVAYFVAGDTAPIVSTGVPDGAVILGTASITAAGPGTYDGSSTITAPYEAGFVTWVWSLSPSSVTASYFAPWTDQFGLPAETTRVAPPVVATQAMAASAIGDDVYDTAMVGGVLPAEPVSLTFEAFFRPSGADAVCDDSTRVFDSSAEPVTISTVGNYDSPVTQFEEYGTYYWIESLYSSTGQLLHRGECGLSEETTLVAPGEVSTLARAAVLPGEPAYDIATVEGLTPRGATLGFEAFVQTNPDGPVCTAANLEFTSSPMKVTGAGLYQSPNAHFDSDGTYYWVETLRDSRGEILHRGVCGAPGETTLVGVSVLASTGVTGIQHLIIGAGLLTLGILAIGSLARGRRMRELR
jgi:hypothetical protein